MYRWDGFLIQSESTAGLVEQWTIQVTWAKRDQGTDHDVRGVRGEAGVEDEARGADHVLREWQW